MFNKSFFLGVLTTLVVVVILATGGLVAVRAFRPAASAGFVAPGRPGGLEPRGGDRQFQPGNPGRQGAPGQVNPRFGQRFGRNFLHAARPGRAIGTIVRGISLLLGGLVLVGLIIAAVVGGSLLFKRSRAQTSPPPAAAASAAATPAAPAEEPGVETPTAAPETPGEPGETPTEPAADENS